MLFHEIYGKYYQCVAQILAAASESELTGRDLRRLTEQTAFRESTLWIPQMLQSGQWPLLEDGRRSVLAYPPELPVTTLERRWLKALLLDPRIQLFAPPMDGLADVSPLYTPDVFVWFDAYADRDPYTDPQYIAVFHTLLTAIRERQRVLLHYRTPLGKQNTHLCDPYRLEYSRKDDKFRVLAMQQKSQLILNLARIDACSLCGPRPEGFQVREPQTSTVVLELTDDRNALERAMLHFSYLEKETVRLKDHRYQITLHYRKHDETELLIQILSFGPMLKVIAPDVLVDKVRARLRRQSRL